MGQEIDVERIRINTVRPIDRRKVARKAAAMRGRRWSFGSLSWATRLSWVGVIVFNLSVIFIYPFCKIESGEWSGGYSFSSDAIYGVECQVRNNGLRPISSVRFRLSWMDGDRSVPIWSAGGEMDIPGGIQSGETKSVRMSGAHQGFDWRSFDRSQMRLRVEITGVGRGRDGKPWSVYPPATIEMPAGSE